jgi:hypothetical protein
VTSTSKQLGPRLHRQEADAYRGQLVREQDAHLMALPQFCILYLDLLGLGQHLTASQFGILGLFQLQIYCSIA